MVPVTRPFSIDEDYDRNHASNTSRYGNYLASRSHRFVDDDTEQPTTDPAQFARLAWEISLSPIMSPGYVRAHPRIQSVSTAWDDDDRFGVAVTLAAPLPTPIAAVVAAGTAGQRWRDWDRDWHSDWWFEPYALDRPAAYTTVTVRIPIPRECLPTPTYAANGEPDVDTGKDTVRVLCARLNSHLQPLFAALDNPPR
jgi:hypothetical protein